MHTPLSQLSPQSGRQVVVPPAVCRSAATTVAKEMGCALRPECAAASEDTRSTVPSVGQSVRGLLPGAKAVFTFMKFRLFSRFCGKYGRCVAPEICGCGEGQQHCRNGSCDDIEHCSCPSGETHFIDRCLKADRLSQHLNTSEKRKHFNRQLAYEFNALIGRLFNF